MTSRILPPDEWPTLVGTELETIWPVLDRERARVIVVEHDGAIVGAWAGYPLWHAEGVYVAPAHRGKAGVARRLLEGMTALALAEGYRSVVTASIAPAIDRLLERHGAVHLDGRHWALPVGDKPCLLP
jgi:GNAT superfamily N-acetyltransferase